MPVKVHLSKFFRFAFFRQGGASDGSGVRFGVFILLSLVCVFVPSYSSYGQSVETNDVVSCASATRAQLSLGEGQLSEMIALSIDSCISWQNSIPLPFYIALGDTLRCVSISELPRSFRREKLRSVTYFSSRNRIPAKTRRMLKKKNKIDPYIYSVELRGNTLRIHIDISGLYCMRRGFWRKRVLAREISDWGNFYFGLDPEKGRWELIGAKFGGI